MIRCTRLAAAGVILAAAGASAQEQEIPRFEGGVDLVSVPVAVTTEDGEFVTGLDAGDFRILEDGVEQEILVFGAGLEESWVDLPPDQKEELSQKQVIGLLLDSSGSMEEDLPLLHEAAIKFLTNIPRTENLFVISFDENIWLSEYSSDDQRIISNRIYDIEAEGWTALYDAVATFLDRVYDYDGRKTLAVLSDGADSRSTLMYSEALDLVKLGDTTIHSIHFGDRSRHSEVFENGRFLRAIAETTGGSYALASSLEQLDELYDRILDELYSQYTIGYASSNTRREGRYRRIEVEVDAPDHDELEIRARRGYFGPYDPSSLPEPGR
jgi:VWFA-related protein